MPNVIFERGLRMMIFPNDHEPMHVHVYCQGRTAVIEFDPSLECGEIRALIAENCDWL